jgi:hypothetical protein
MTALALPCTPRLGASHLALPVFSSLLCRAARRPLSAWVAESRASSRIATLVLVSAYSWLVPPFQSVHYPIAFRDKVTHVTPSRFTQARMDRETSASSRRTGNQPRSQWAAAPAALRIPRRQAPTLTIRRSPLPLRRHLLKVRVASILTFRKFAPFLFPFLHVLPRTQCYSPPGRGRSDFNSVGPGPAYSPNVDAVRRKPAAFSMSGRTTLPRRDDGPGKRDGAQIHCCRVMSGDADPSYFSHIRSQRLHHKPQQRRPRR